MKKLLLFNCFIFPVLLFSQNEKDTNNTLNIQLYYDKPQANLLNFSANFGGVTDAVSVPMGLFFNARMDLGKRLSLHGKYFTEISSFSIDEKLKSLSQNSSYKPIYTAQLRATINFESKDNNTKQYIELGKKSQSNGVTINTTTYSYNATMKQRNSKGLTFSISNSKVMFCTQKKDSTLTYNFEVFDKNGNKINSYQNNLLGFQNITMASIGINQTSRIFYKAKFTAPNNPTVGSKIKRKKIVIDANIDLLFAINTTVNKNIMVLKQDGSVLVYEIKNPKLQRFGARFDIAGYMAKPGLALNFSLGSRPGIKQQTPRDLKWLKNLFVEMGIGLGF